MVAFAQVLTTLEAGVPQLMLPCHHVHALIEQSGEHEITGVIAIRQHNVSTTESLAHVP